METAMAHHGKPYLWGGNDPLGFDCSGYVIECLRAGGVVHKDFDTTADGLWNKFRKQYGETDKPGRGTLAFWLDRGGIARHVTICVSETSYIGAEGGSSESSDRIRAVKVWIDTLPQAARFFVFKICLLIDAWDNDAFIKIAQLSSRPGAKFVHIWK